MNLKHQSEDWVYEKLYKSIMKAISHSPEVQEIIEKLESHGLTKKMAAVNVIFSMDELAELARNPSKKESQTKNHEASDYSEDFDETRWMKQAKIKV